MRRARSGCRQLVLFSLEDGQNDVGMLQFADCGYAVANACAEARAAADVIVGGCDSDGVAEAIAHFIHDLSIHSQRGKGG